LSLSLSLSLYTGRGPPSPCNMLNMLIFFDFFLLTGIGGDFLFHLGP
jgi:hypothetical protein